MALADLPEQPPDRSCLCNLCVLCVSVVGLVKRLLTTEAQRAQRLHREITSNGFQGCVLNNRDRNKAMMLAELQGWMPIDAVVVDGRPGLTWLEMTGVDLAEPFFQQTVDRVKSKHPERREVFTEFDTLVQLEKTFDTVAPTGFIFHSSRCGSTLLANACRA